MRGLVVGRFQPFHLGHLALARQALSECGGLVLAATGAQFNYIGKDPFTAGERLEMMHLALAEDGADMARCHVAAVENRPDSASWAAYLRSSLPRFGRVYSGNDYVAMLLADSGVEVVRPEFEDRGRLCGTAVRRLMAEGGDWRGLVPPAVAGFLEGIGAEARVRAISKSDTDPTTH